MFNPLYKLKSMFLTFFGDIKIYPFPFFVIYCPDSFRVKGTDTREAMHLVRPGDLVLRKYRHYLDGYFIPGAYSHTGIYAGGGKVIHAVAEGVSGIDLIDFLRCDAFAILRPRAGIKNALTLLQKHLGKPYDFSFCSGNERYYCHELAAAVYPELNIQQYRPSLFGLKLPFLSKTYLAESFLNSPDFKLILEKQPKRKVKIMKNLAVLLLLAAVVTAAFTGCAAVNTATASFHNTAVSFAKTTAKAKAQEKIDALVEEKKITPEYGKELSARADQELAEIFAKIDELYARYKELKEAKEAKEEEAAQVEQEPVPELPEPVRE